MKCPGQDTRNWKPEDIFEVNCPVCGAPVEFFKDEMRLRCSQCRKIVPNPRANFGCAEHCQYSDQCVGPELARQIREKAAQDKK